MSIVANTCTILSNASIFSVLFCAYVEMNHEDVI